MLKPKIVPLERKLNLHVHKLPDNEHMPKSTFIDSNRIDTVRSKKRWKQRLSKIRSLGLCT